MAYTDLPEKIKSVFRLLSGDDYTVGASLDTALGGESISNNVIEITKKPTISSSYSATPGIAAYNDVDILVKPSEGQVFAIACNNKNVAERFLWIKNKATVIAGADTVTAGTDIVIPLAASSNNLLVFGEDFLGTGGFNCQLGITIGISTSATSFTAATTTDHYVVYFYA